MKTVAAGTLIALAGCASLPEADTLEWSTIGTGCYGKGISDVLLTPADFGRELGITDIRIGRLPDTGQGPGLVAHFRRGLRGAFGQQIERPEVFLAVGDWKTTCSVVVEPVSCPVADDIYRKLAAQSIPVGHAFDDPQPITVMHGTTHFLSVRDGHANQTDWSYYGLDHPLQRVVSESLDRLHACATPAASAFEQAGR